MAKKYAASNMSSGNSLDATVALPSQTKPGASKEPKRKRSYRRKSKTNREMIPKEEEFDGNQNSMVII